MKRFFCWLTGHKWQPRPVHKVQEDYNNRRPLRLVECTRCGVFEP